MVHAISAQFPFLNGENLVVYHPSPMEKYFPVAPGLEVSVEPQDEARWEQEGSSEVSLYNRQGRMVHPKNRGVLVDTLL